VEISTRSNTSWRTTRLDSLASEQHFTAQQLSENWAVSAMTIYRWFENEPGVLIFGPDETMYKRKKKSMRIPKSVAERVHERLHTRKIQ